MKIYNAGEYDIIVVGAGHAGCEAALASARLGNKTLCLTINLDSVAMMPCNPSIGGTGKGHLVREIDALGGEMGKVIDQTMIQSRMLNLSKGPAVHSLRAQADKNKYHIKMKQVLEDEPNLFLKQAEVVALDIKDSKVCGVITATSSYYKASAVILATGTYLDSKIHIGESIRATGPNGMATSVDFAKFLRSSGFDMRRFKTGTPARVAKKSINFSVMEVQEGDNEIVPFSFMTDKIEIEQVPCYLTYTNDKTHDIINKNIKTSAVYSGQIDGVGPRYCPSIEDKVVRFSDRKRHQMFIEPEGLDTSEMYIQGMSSSLAEGVQVEFMRSIKGLENCEIMRPAHAIEYDCMNPLELLASLEFKHTKNLFSAGQFNGSSGYEEAGAQGLIAGINASNKIHNKPAFVLDRSEAYIGVLIDDLVTKGTNEPYRIMTGRCEYRLLLRQDNADLRLTEYGYQQGLVSEERYHKFTTKKSAIDLEMERLKNTKIRAEKINNALETSAVTESMTLYELMRRPEISYDDLKNVDTERPILDRAVIEQCEIQIKYYGYIQKQLLQVEKFKRMEKRIIPERINYLEIEGIRNEAKQKLNDIKPYSVGQASRISGVSPADISVLLVYLEQQRRSDA